jgi:hypothetical protein
MHTPCVLYVYLCNTTPQSRVCQAAQLLPGLSSIPLMREAVLAIAQQLCCGSLFIYAHSWCIICIFMQHRAPQSRLCQAALLLPGLVLTPLVSESVRPAFASTPLMRDPVLPSSSAAGTSLRTAHRRDGAARQLCCGSFFIYVYTYMYNHIT